MIKYIFLFQIENGKVVFRWELGSGEGLIIGSSKTVNDGHWHSISLKRNGRMASIAVDGELFPEEASPGFSENLNLENQYLYLGAEVWTTEDSEETRRGFIGCMDGPKVNGISLPYTQVVPTELASIKRHSHIISQCFGIWNTPGQCGSNPCLNGGTCSEDGKSYKCLCYSRFTGSRCEHDSNPCASSPCLNNGYCVKQKDSYRCECSENTSGSRCEYVHCNRSPCLNGGYCEEGNSEAICICKGFTGQFCTNDIDECERNPCKSGGTCINTIGGFRCLCFENSTGLFCEKPVSSPIAFSVGAVSINTLLTISNL